VYAYVLARFAIVFTLSVTFACSLTEALITEHDQRGDRSPQAPPAPARGQLLEILKLGLEDTMSAILTLNTIATTLGS